MREYLDDLFMGVDTYEGMDQGPVVLNDDQMIDGGRQWLTAAVAAARKRGDLEIVRDAEAQLRQIDTDPKAWLATFKARLDSLMERNGRLVPFDGEAARTASAGSSQ